jgi:hypothetical protein
MFRTLPQHRASAVVLAALTATAGCGTDSPATPAADKTTTTVAPVIDPGDGGHYDPQLVPADFVDAVDNPYFPLAVGSHWVYEGEADTPGSTEHVEVVVLPDRKDILGISATVVRDTVTVDGALIEDTYDWYAQDKDGNVWYLGEDVKNYENGKVVDTEGSFEAGVDGALPGIVMLAHPAVGDAYRQEYYAGTAEDLGEVTSVGGSKTVPAGDYTDVVVTKDWNPLEADVIEQKTYAPGIGVIYEEQLEGGSGTSALIAFTP